MRIGSTNFVWWILMFWLALAVLFAIPIRFAPHNARPAAEVFSWPEVFSGALAPGVLVLALVLVLVIVFCVRELRKARALGRERLRFLQYGMVVVANVTSVAKPGSPGERETHFSYEYQLGGTQHVCTLVKPFPQPLWSPYQLIYHPADPENPRIVRDLYPDLIVEADAVRFRDPPARPLRAPVVLQTICAVLVVVFGVLIAL